MSNAASRDAPPGSYVVNHAAGTLVADRLSILPVPRPGAIAAFDGTFAGARPAGIGRREHDGLVAANRVAVDRRDRMSHLPQLGTHQREELRLERQHVGDLHVPEAGHVAR